MAELGVNIDHVATVRQARRAAEPDPVVAAMLAELGGADCITLHVREDRRHMQDRDLRVLREVVSVKLNLELAANHEIVRLACEVKPDQATLVPERREELTTEGGLDVVGPPQGVVKAIAALRSAGISISLFLDPDPRQLEAAKTLGVDAIELHTGEYARAREPARLAAELDRLIRAGNLVREMGLNLHAGHGLNYHNIRPVAAIEGMRELNIGHSIVARAVMVGFERAVREMKALVE